MDTSNANTAPSAIPAGFVSAFVDGEQRIATVAPDVEGLWTPFQIRYRQATAGEVDAAFENKSNGFVQTTRFESHVSLLATKVDGWNLQTIKDGALVAVPCDAPRITGVTYACYTEIREIVYGGKVANNPNTGEQHATRADNAKNLQAA